LLHICTRYTRTRRREVERQAEQKNAKKKEKRKKMDWAADPPPSWAVFPRQPNDLNHYQVGDLVFCKATPKAIEPFWPGKLIDPIEAPSAVRASCVPDAVCVMFYGPATIKKHDRD